MSTERRYRREARFVMDPAALSTPLDGNQRAKILHKCEIMERKTKGKGQRNGILGVPAIMVLRCLLMRFHNQPRFTPVHLPGSCVCGILSHESRHAFSVPSGAVSRAAVSRGGVRTE